MEKGDPSYIVGGNASWNSHSGKQCGGLLKSKMLMLKIELPYDPAIALLGIYSKDIEVVKGMAICTSMFIAALTTIAKLWKELRCPSTDEWIRRCGPYIQMNSTQPSKRTITQHLQHHGRDWRS